MESTYSRKDDGGRGGEGTTLRGWEPQPLGTWLVIRYDVSDMGARPLPSGDVFWTSPDIWITGGDRHGNPIGGQPAVVHARIWNFGGLDACPVIVDFSYIEPGLGLPVNKPIGKIGAIVPAANYTEVAVPWTPPKVEGNVHTCIIVTCSCDVICNDVPKSPGNVVADRHTGQRNMTIIGTPVKKIDFRLGLTNLRPRTAMVQLGARALWSNARDLLVIGVTDLPSVRTAVQAIDRPHSQVEYRLLSRRAAMVSRRMLDGHFSLLSEGTVSELVRVNSIDRGHIYNTGAVIPPRDRIDATYSSVAVVGRGEELKSLQHASVHFEIAIPQGNKHHEWLVLHLAQITEGAIEGGYTVVLHTGKDNDDYDQQG
jgi:hypothetical protein